MKSVTRDGATVQEATAAALAALGADEDVVDIEVLSRPRRGLFGRGTKATVRASLRESRAAAAGDTTEDTRTQAVRGTLPPRPADGDGDQDGDQDGDGDATADTGVEAGAPSRRENDEEDTPMTETGTADTADEITGADSEGGAATEETPDIDQMPPDERVELLDEECDLAADFIEGLLDLLDLPGDIVIEATEDSAVVNVVDVGSGLLIGRRGATLDALQELVRSSTQRQTERRSHVRVDVEGYRARQLDKLRTKCRDAIAEVRETGQAFKLEPMDAYERKMMHDLVARTGGVSSASEGSEPRRRVVIKPE